MISSCDPPQAPFGEGTYIEKSREIVVLARGLLGDQGHVRGEGVVETTGLGLVRRFDDRMFDRRVGKRDQRRGIEAKRVDQESEHVTGYVGPDGP